MRRESGANEKVETPPRGADLCVGIQLLDNTLSPGRDLTSLWIAAIIEVDSTVRVIRREYIANPVKAIDSVNIPGVIEGHPGLWVIWLCTFGA
jgi:hypothetical protein